MEVISNPERELAKKVADMAMVSGWDKAIMHYALEAHLGYTDMEKILDDAAKYNDKADPSGRIEELEDWKRHNKRTRFIGPEATRQVARPR